MISDESEFSFEKIKHHQHHNKPTWHNPLLDDFFVVTVISNPVRYRRRPELYYRFEEMCLSAGVRFVTVELSFGDRPPMVTKRENELHLQVKSFEEFWHKENLINLGIAHGRRLWPNMKHVAWIDADCAPARTPRDWFEETWHELQHYKFVQMWEKFQPLDHYYSPIGGPSPSFMANYIKHGTAYPSKKKDDNGYPIVWGSPGLAWAAEIKYIDQIGGIPDAAILGAGDWYLAHMLISDLDIPTMKNYSKGYRDYWLNRALLINRYIKKDVGYVRGLVYHYWHGHQKNRKYNSREKILIHNQFDPNVDLKRDNQGLYQMETYENRQIKMYHEIRQYFRQRNEDEI